jgi:hypothetical protein
MLWVHLDSNYCVRNVYAKYYAGDKICIYSLSWKQDETTLEEIPSEVALYINEELFDKCFKSKKSKNYENKTNKVIKTIIP